MDVIKKRLLILIISIALLLQDVIVFRYACNCNFDGPNIDYYGFPFIYRNNLTQACSGCGNLYLSGFIGNILFWFMLIYIFYFIYVKFAAPIINLKIQTFFAWLLTITSIGIILFNIYVYEWTIEMSCDQDLYCKESQCKREIKFFIPNKDSFSVYP